MIAELIYLLCAATSLVAALLLMRQYFASRSPLLLWSFIGFAGLGANNVLVYLDMVVVQTVDLSLPRTMVGAAAVMALLFGLIWETR